jgi:hypothetical protein
MISKMWAALGICAALMIGGISVVAAGNMNGDCLQTNDQLQLKDGTGDNCPDADEPLAATDGTCDSCMDYNWSFLYGETDLESPYQSACGQGEDSEDALAETLTADGVCEPTLNSYFHEFLFGETDLEPPYKAHAGDLHIV